MTGGTNAPRWTATLHGRLEDDDRHERPEAQRECGHYCRKRAETDGGSTQKDPEAQDEERNRRDKPRPEDDVASKRLALFEKVEEEENR